MSLLHSESCGSRYEASFCAIGNLELREDGRDVVANGLLAEEKLCRDLCVRAPLSEELEDLELAVGELRKRLARVNHRRRGKEAPEPVGNPRAEDRFAVRYGADRAERLVLDRASSGSLDSSLHVSLKRHSRTLAQRAVL